jgi:hypothetical protein
MTRHARTAEEPPSASASMAKLESGGNARTPEEPAFASTAGASGHALTAVHTQLHSEVSLQGVFVCFRECL